MEADFSGWATRNNIVCTDGRTILPDAFKHQDKMKVPLVWAHQSMDPQNVLGHAILENRPEGVYTRAFFNDTENGRHAKALVHNKDVTALSIYANRLVEKNKMVSHGNITEVSLVLAGANPGAVIDAVNLQHNDEDGEDRILEGIIYTGLYFQHSDEDANQNESDKDDVLESESLEHANEGDKDMADNNKDEKTFKEIFDSMTEEQQGVTLAMVDEALKRGESDDSDDSDDKDDTDDKDAKHSDDKNEDQLQHNQEGADMSRNTFDQNQDATLSGNNPHRLSPDQMAALAHSATKLGSLKEAVLAHAQDYGIIDINLLFPEAKLVSDKPELLARRTEWVAGIINGAKHTPFSRIRSLAADLTAEEARAKGYVKGNYKKEEVIKLLKRETVPTTVYKKQKLDRDDILDIVDFDVVAWLKWEIRFMLEEELARAILIGDGREIDDPDKIDEDKLRPIAWDHEMYAHPVNVPTDTTPEGLVESIIRARKNYKGTGTPTLYTQEDILTDMILIKDKMGRRVYNTEAELAAALRVARIVPVEVMDTVPNLLAIIVNIADYTIGADKGGSLSFFEDFDIDYNQQKYLMETRISGALTKPKSALVIKRVNGTTVVPQVPTFDQATDTLTIPNQAGVTYWNVTNPLSETQFASGPIVITETTDVEARPAAGYNFPHNTDNDWTYAVTA